MRMFDIKNSWLDNEGKPLAGRVSFCKLHTTELENIYDVSGTALDNPIFTNTIGQLTQQVFLADNTDYTIRFEKYVGVSDMTVYPDNWLFQYSCDNLWNTYGIEVDSTTFQLVNNITDLRELDPQTITTRDNKKVVVLGGYNEIGDKPQVMYVWNATSIESDNGGSVIKVDNIATGRWELVNVFDSDGVDVRHFGVFGTDSRQDATDTMSLQIGMANSYAASIGLPLYFPAIDGLTWYKINNLTIAGAKFADNTRVFGNTGTASTLTVYDENSYLSVFNNSDYNAVFTITGPVVKTSWGVNSTNCVFDPTYKLIVDSVINTYNKSFAGIVIDCQYEILDRCSFDNCQIHSVEKLGDYTTFKNCILTESMFSSTTDFNTVTVYDSDVIDIEDWPSTVKWCILRKQNTPAPIDFKGRTLNSDCDLGWTTGSLLYSNAVFDGFTIKQPEVVLDNCSGTASCLSLSTLSVKNCNVDLSDTSGAGTITSLAGYDSTLNISTSKVFNTVHLERTAFSSDNMKYITNLYMNYSILNSSVQVQTCGIYNTTINANIISGVSGFIFENCVFNASHTINVVMANSIVSGKWINNNGVAANPIVINDTNNYLLDEEYQTYTYERNYGTFVPTKATKFLNFTSANIENFQYSSSIDYPNAGNIGFYMRSSNIKLICPNVNSEMMQVFRVGNNATYLVKIKVFIDATYNGVSWHPSYEYFKYKDGNTPDVNWINGYDMVPQFETYMESVGTTTPSHVKFYVEIEKINKY